MRGNVSTFPVKDKREIDSLVTIVSYKVGFENLKKKIN